MKKVLALVLAVMMLSTMAFAFGDVSNPNYADDVVETANTVAFGGQYAPGSTLYVYKDMDYIIDSGAWVDDDGDNRYEDNSDITPSPDTFNAQVTSANYNITNQRWTQGHKDLLAGLEFDDKNNQLKIKITEDYTLKQPKVLRGSFTLKGKNKGGYEMEYYNTYLDKKGNAQFIWLTADEETAWNADSDKAAISRVLKNGKVQQRNRAVKPVTIKVVVDITVGNWKQSVALSKDNDVTLNTLGLDAYKNYKTGEPVDPDGIYDNTVTKFTGDAYGTVIINCADEKDTEVTFRAYKGDEVFLENETGADDALLKAYADKDAEISFLKFVANPTLNSTATIRFYKDEDSHVYIKKDGKLVQEVKWDDDEDCFVLKTRTLGEYVFSDKALPLNAPTAADTNPDTGANDVVGIATALAAVALVSAAAVSLKK